MTADRSYCSRREDRSRHWGVSWQHVPQRGSPMCSRRLSSCRNACISCTSCRTRRSSSRKPCIRNSHQGHSPKSNSTFPKDLRQAIRRCSSPPPLRPPCLKSKAAIRPSALEKCHGVCRSFQEISSRQEVCRDTSPEEGIDSWNARRTGLACRVHVLQGISPNMDRRVRDGARRQVMRFPKKRRVPTIRSFSSGNGFREDRGSRTQHRNHFQECDSTPNGRNPSFRIFSSLRDRGSRWNDDPVQTSTQRRP